MNLPNMVSISEVSTGIGKLLDSGKRYLILKNSKPVAAIVSVDDFERLREIDSVEAKPEKEVVA